MRRFPLARVHQLIEGGPVVFLTTRRKGRSNVMTMSWHMMVEFEPPLVAECFANLECKVRDKRFVAKYNLFILEVIQAWIDPAQKRPKTIHHQGYGRFVVDGPTLTLKSKAR